MPLERLDGAEQAARFVSIGDCRAVDGLGSDNRFAKVGGNVPLGAGRCDGVAKYLVACAAQALGDFVAALALHVAEHHQQFLRGDGGDGAPADGLVDEAQQPAELLHGESGAALPLDLHQPFVGNRLEAVGRRHGSGEAVQLDLLGRVFALRQNLAGGVALLAGVGKAGVGINAEGQRPLLGHVAIVHPPIAPAIGRHIQKQPIAIG